MKEELEQQLEHDFPFMQKSRVKEERNTYKNDPPHYEREY